MPEPADSVADEARASAFRIKELLASRDPWDKEIESLRKELRKSYLKFLLLHPYRWQASFEHHLWMQTTYQFIARYKQLIADSERRTGPRHGTNADSGPVAQRKTIQRFRQFLAEEEKFYLQLVARCRRTFDLSEVHKVLVDLNLVPNVGPESKAHESLSAGHHHYLFPSDEMTHPPHNVQQRSDCLTLVARLLIYLGDIARYRELYNESGGRPKAGQDDGPPKKGGRNKKGAPEMAKARNYERAQNFYQQARSLVPTYGHSFHQMAIIASYQRDTFGSLLYYYRAICTAFPYEVASDNLRNMLEKVGARWKTEGERIEPPRLDGQDFPIRIKVHIFHTHLASLHALWRLGAEQTDAISPNLAEDVAAMFASLISQRLLTEEQIYKSIVLTQAALYKHKAFRERHRSRLEGLSTEENRLVEERMLAHIVGFHSVLLKEGLSQLAEPPPVHNATNGQALAQRITANFRRTLPALRIASKWLRCNFKYVVNQGADFLQAFWGLYANFVRSLAKEFPLSVLPSTMIRLEEDVELIGFAPLKKFLSADKNTAPSLDHPNKEHLTRIADLIRDAEALTREKNSPLVLRGGFVMVKEDSLKGPTRSSAAHRPLSSSIDQDMSDQSDTDSTMERMVEVLELDDDDDHIVYLMSQPEPTLPSPPRQQAQRGPVTPQRNVSGPSAPRSPTTPTRQSQSAQPQTASDFLHNIMTTGSPPHFQQPLSSPPMQVHSGLPPHNGFTTPPHLPSLPSPPQVSPRAWLGSPTRRPLYTTQHPHVSNLIQQPYAPLPPATGFPPFAPPFGVPNTTRPPAPSHHVPTSPPRRQSQAHHQPYPAAFGQPNGHSGRDFPSAWRRET